MRRVVMGTLLGLLMLSCGDPYQFPASPYPQVQTLPEVDATEQGFTVRINVTELGDLPINSYGFTWGVKGFLSIESETVTFGPILTPGIYEGTIDGALEEGVVYTVRPFVGTAEYDVIAQTVDFTL